MFGTLKDALIGTRDWITDSWLWKVAVVTWSEAPRSAKIVMSVGAAVVAWFFFT